MFGDLNPAQYEAVHTLSGPLLVLAGAGSGKTRVVAFRMANLIRHGTRPNRILAVTFTNKAAQEMIHRVTAQLGKSEGRGKQKLSKEQKPQVGTFHSHCVQILRRHAKVLGYPEKFAIYDRGDQESIARGVLRDLRVHNETMRPGDLLALIGRWKNASVTPSKSVELAQSDKEHLAASGYRRYQKALKLAGAFDFDDLLLCTEELLMEHPKVREEEAARFDHILVDEYQDTNGSQYRIIKSLATHRNLCVVGDDDQSIYGWRGAEVEHILNFQKDWPDSKVVRLVDNYRSTSAILELANRLIQFNTKRHGKILQAARPGGAKPRVLQFKTETEEAEGIVAEIRRLLDRKVHEPKDIAILFRTNEQPRVFETELRKAKLPYVLMGSQSFFDRKEVRDILSYLRIIDSPQDEVSMLRIMNVPPRGLGAKSIETLLGSAVSQGKNLWDVMQQSAMVAELPEPARKGVSQIRSIIDHYGKQSQESSLVDIVKSLVDEIGYEDEIRRLYPEPEEQQNRLAAVEEVCNAIGEYEANNDEASLGGFLADVALAGKEFGSGSDKNAQRNAIWLMTMHSAKGLEFPIVYMVGMEEGFLPHRRSITGSDEEVEEERRLCYVGVTRAQDQLTLSLALSRMKWGKPRPTFPSRFLYELTGQADNPNRVKAIQGARKENSSGGKKSPPPKKGRKSK